MFKKSILVIAVLSCVNVSFGSNARIALNEKVKKEVIEVLEANEKLHVSFFEYNGKKIETSASAVKEKIGKISDPEISKLLKYPMTKLSEMKSGSERADNDKNYHLVSMALINIVKKYDVGEKYNAFTCPMVKKKWLQNTKKMPTVHNPYAPDMPTCGMRTTSH